MNDLIKALTILAKYDNPSCPLHCEHGELLVMIDPKLVTPEDLSILASLSFRPQKGCFVSYRFGSA